HATAAAPTPFPTRRSSDLMLPELAAYEATRVVARCCSGDSTVKGLLPPRMSNAVMVADHKSFLSGDGVTSSRARRWARQRAYGAQRGLQDPAGSSAQRP